MIYPTKKDAWLVLIVALAGLLLIIQLFNRLIFNGLHNPGTWILCAVFIFYFGILILFAYPVYYEITTSALKIRSGILLRYTIPLSSIVHVVPTRNPVSSPAWSLDRLRIEYLKDSKKRIILISPKDKKTFIRELIARSPSLELTMRE